VEIGRSAACLIVALSLHLSQLSRNTLISVVCLCVSCIVNFIVLCHISTLITNRHTLPLKDLWVLIYRFNISGSRKAAWYLLSRAQGMGRSWSCYHRRRSSVWTHPSAEPSCLCPARPRLPTRRSWNLKRWSRNMAIYWYYRQMTTAAGMRKRWSIKLKAIDFSTTRYRSVHFRRFFTACLWSKRSRGCEQGEFSATSKIGFGKSIIFQAAPPRKS